MNTRIFAVALSCAAAVSLSACNTLGLPTAPAGAAGQQITSVLNTANTAVANNCQVDAHLTMAPPLPPMGSLNLSCSPRGPLVAPLSQIQALTPAVAPGAAPTVGVTPQ